MKDRPVYGENKTLIDGTPDDCRVRLPAPPHDSSHLNGALATIVSKDDTRTLACPSGGDEAKRDNENKTGETEGKANR